MLKGIAYNFVINPAAAALLAKIVQDDDTAHDVWTIVAIDTLFRMALSHALSACKLTPATPKTVGNLLFLSSTLITQPLSTLFAQKVCGIKKPTYLNTLAYIFFGWKANLMVKDVVYVLRAALLQS